jgi:5-hydroxyisourate hydrolase
MSAITTHVLDAVLGKPAAGIYIRLETREAVAGLGEMTRDDEKAEGESDRIGDWVTVSVSATDADGRCRDLGQTAEEGIYRLTFFTGPYLKSRDRSTIYPEISITFTCDGEQHYHLPLLLSDNSYTTYRGS